LCRKIFFDDKEKLVIEVNQNKIILKNDLEKKKFVFDLRENSFQVIEINFDYENSKDRKYIFLFNNNPDFIDIDSGKKLVSTYFRNNYNKLGNILNFQSINNSILLNEDFFYEVLRNTYIYDKSIFKIKYDSPIEFMKKVEDYNLALEIFYRQLTNNFEFNQICKFLDSQIISNDNILFSDSLIANSYLNFFLFKKEYLKSIITINNTNFNIFEVIYYINYLIYLINYRNFNTIINKNDNQKYNFISKEMSNFINCEISDNSNIYEEKSKEEKLIKNHFQIKQIIINRFSLKIKSNNFVHSNRFLRKYFYADNFIKVNFKNELGNKLQTNKYKTNSLEYLYHLIKNEGLKLFNKNYEFFFYTTTNLRSNSVWLIESNSFNSKLFQKLKITNKEDLYLQLGLRNIAPYYSQRFDEEYIFNENKNIKKSNIYDYNNLSIQKIISNISLNFSSTIELLIEDENQSEINIEIGYEKDIKTNTQNFTHLEDNNIKILSDGCGKISSKLIDLICLKYNNKILASAIQIRYNGNKGVLAKLDELDGYKIVFVDSMIKFPGEINNKLELISFSKFLKGSLNIQIILILLLRRFPITFFLKLFKNKKMNLINGNFSIFKNKLIRIEKIFHTKTNKDRNKEKNNILENKICIPNLDNINYNILVYYKFLDLMGKFKIHLKKSCYLMGIIDYYGILKENEVFIHFSNNKRENYIIKNEVLILKNPVYSVNDIKLLNCIENEFLKERYKDVIVFPSTGRYSIPASLSNSDLDGDFYYIIYEKSFIKEFKKSENNSILKNYKNKIHDKNSKQQIYSNCDIENYKWPTDFCKKTINEVYLPREKKFDHEYKFELETIKFECNKSLNFEDNIFEYFVFYNIFQKVSYINEKYFSDLSKELNHKKLIIDKKHQKTEEYENNYKKLLEENNNFEIKANIEIDFSKKGLTIDCYKQNTFDEEKNFMHFRKNDFLKSIDFNEIILILNNLKSKFGSIKLESNRKKFSKKLIDKAYIFNEKTIEKNNNNNFNIEFSPLKEEQYNGVEFNDIFSSKNYSFNTRNPNENLPVDYINNKIEINGKSDSLLFNIHQVIFPENKLNDMNWFFNKTENFSEYIINFCTIASKSNFFFNTILKKSKDNKYLRNDQLQFIRRKFNQSSYLDLILENLFYNDDNHCILEISIINSFVNSILLFMNYENEILKKENYLEFFKIIKEVWEIVKKDLKIKDRFKNIINIINEYSNNIKIMLFNFHLLFEYELIFVDIIYPNKAISLNKNEIQDWKMRVKVELNYLNEKYYSLLINNIEELHILNTIFKERENIIVILEYLIFSNKSIDKFIYDLNLYITGLTNPKDNLNYKNSIYFINNILDDKIDKNNFYSYFEYLKITKIYGLYLYFIKKYKET